MTVENGDYNKRDYGKKIFTAPMVQMKSQEESDWKLSILFSTVAHNCHIKYKLLTLNTNYSHQKQIAHVKYKLLTSNTKSWHQKQD